MGEAKRRGTLEQRIAAAAARQSKVDERRRLFEEQLRAKRERGLTEALRQRATLRTRILGGS